MKVYHGSPFKVECPAVSAGRPNLDFGQGFYLTDLREQAERWARTVVRRYDNATPRLNIYELDLEGAVAGGFRILRFKAYDKDWLDFIVSSRSGGERWKEYDIIEGGIANDRVIDTVEAYIDGLIDENRALAKLTEYRPNNQIAILNQKVADACLAFVDCLELEMSRP